MKTLNYLLILDRAAAPGVYGKVSGTVNSFNRNGFPSKSTLISPKGIKSYIKLLSIMFSDKSDILLLRFNSKISFTYPLLCLYRKIYQRITICDVPTPLVNLGIELSTVHKFSFKNIIHNFCYIFVFPISFMSFNLILEYAHESKWISFFSRKNRILISNAVEINHKHKNTFQESKSSNRYNFIAVGTIAPWHGWDKFLYALDMYKKNNPNYDDFHLKVIGDGPDRMLLEEIVSENDLSDVVTFYGNIPFEDIAMHYQDQHIGLGSLGWERVGVSIASPIKSREYLMNGLNVLYATQDMDLDNFNLAFALPHGCTVDDIYNYLINIKSIYKYSPISCIDFASDNCSFDKVCKKILCRLDL